METGSAGHAGRTGGAVATVIERSTNQVDWSSFTGAPSYLLATNQTEFFRAQRLIVEDARVVRD